MTNTFLTAVIGIASVNLCVCLYGLIRNAQVYKFRYLLINKCGELIKADILSGKMPVYDPWRFDAFESVSYERMLWHFWKPLKPRAWYSDTSFLEPKGEKANG